MSDSRALKKLDAPTPEQQLVADVSDKVGHHLLAEAYDTLKAGVQARFANENANEKAESWKQIADGLAKDGSLQKLTAPFLRDAVALGADRNKDGLLQLDELSSIAKNAKDPMYKGLAGQAVKEFDVASRLNRDDQGIDRLEIKALEQRQFMPSRDQFSASLVSEINSKLNENPLAAVDLMQKQLSMRGSMETPTERFQTWQAVADQLSQQNLVPKMSMAFLTYNKDIFEKDGKAGFSLTEINQYANSKSPIMREFVSYLSKQFSNIATVDYDYDNISPKEQSVWESKMLNQ